MRKTLLAATAALMALSGAAYAQTMVITQDPVVTNSTIVMPGEVRTYVMEQPVESIPYEGDVVVGRVLPEAVEVRPVQGYSDYGYTIVNERRVIVNPQTRAVIQVLE
ncbi:DUF1236 domain-containing protein [Rhizobium sp. XQZ8]|jgi:hypothetical protein|uniref:DUF1236 domain-containing protein n=1 Tax=Rhizobium populisoli TaxID=2859785 RepID=UPI001C66E57C|nr:DUF1236 domain-containing protein [Rhizobium populisoli]MBW6420484.1 DUF1236 domain-containing protein [Rhizobium populisoli]